MPSQNTLRDNLAENYYHIYSRGVNKQVIFDTATEKQYFINLLNRYMSKTVIENKGKGGFYSSFDKQISIHSYILMDNHFHLLIYQHNEDQIAKFMQCLLNAYVAFYNKKHKRVGYLFQSRYKAKIITDESYWLHISRYIHRNHSQYQQYKFSSFRAYAQIQAKEPFLTTERVLSAFINNAEYLQFVKDYSNLTLSTNQIE